MDDPERTSTSEPDLPDAAQAATSGADEREVLEGEVFQPRERTAQGVGQSEGSSALSEAEHRDTTGDTASAGQRESVERGLAQYVFMREERYREVRLTFRDASPSDIARTFRSTGAHLITLAAERASAHDSPIATPPMMDSESADSDVAGEADEDSENIRHAPKHKTARQRSSKSELPTGEVLLRYFYSLGETVYTVSIASPTGVASSIAGIYPLAARSERELTERLAVIFV